MKPVTGSVRVAVGGVEVFAPDFSCDHDTGAVTFEVPPPEGAMITAGFLFDVPVRFDTDYLAIDLSAFDAGDIPDLPVIEIIP